MPLEMLVSRDWLRGRILADPDVESDAGIPFADFEQLGMFVAPDLVRGLQDEKIVELKMAFGILLHQLRRRDRLTIAELSQRADVDEEELRRIEHDATYKPRPRTVHQLANVFGMPTAKFMKLSGATVTVDARFRAEALKYAAHSDDLSQLTDPERHLLNDFVTYLGKQDGQ